jgi:hypothetical protein
MRWELGIVAFVEREIVINQQLHAFIPTSVIDPLFLLNALHPKRILCSALQR